jgi:hypothetical protein
VEGARITAPSVSARYAYEDPAAEHRLLASLSDLDRRPHCHHRRRRCALDRRRVDDLHYRRTGDRLDHLCGGRADARRRARSDGLRGRLPDVHHLAARKQDGRPPADVDPDDPHHRHLRAGDHRLAFGTVFVVVEDGRYPRDHLFAGRVKEAPLAFRTAWHHGRRDPAREGHCARKACDRDGRPQDDRPQENPTGGTADVAVDRRVPDRLSDPLVERAGRTVSCPVCRRATRRTSW